MADLKISALPASTTPLAGTEVVPLVQSSTTKKVAVSDLTAGRSVSVGNLTVTTAATTATGSANINSSDPTVRYKVTGGTADKNTYEFRAIAAGAGFDYFQIRKINDAQTVFTELYKFDNGGDLTVSLGNVVMGTAGKGIDFSANTHAAGMTSELLTWYEEGTWTPSLGGNTTYTTQTGTYTRIGRQVTIRGVLVVNAIGSGSTSIISGLPFAISGSSLVAAFSYFSDLSQNIVYLTLYGSSTDLVICGLTAASANISYSLGVLKNSSRIDFAATYFV